MDFIASLVLGLSIGNEEPLCYLFPYARLVPLHFSSKYKKLHDSDNVKNIWFDVCRRAPATYRQAPRYMCMPPSLLAYLSDIEKYLGRVRLSEWRMKYERLMRRRCQSQRRDGAYGFAFQKIPCQYGRGHPSGRDSRVDSDGDHTEPTVQARLLISYSCLSPHHSSL